VSCTSKTNNIAETLETKVNQEVTPTYNPNRNLYFGDLHLHTSWSFDAFMTDVRVGPDDAYRYGKGEAISHISGQPIQMKRPLDFMAVSDHAEYMGALVQMLDVDHPLSQLALAEKLRSRDEKAHKSAMSNLRLSIGLNWPRKKLIQQNNLQDTWQRMVEIADAHYEPGTFTTFPAFEWTSSVGVKSSLVIGPRYAQNLHRNVIYKGGQVSSLPFSSFDSQNPERLWDWMELQREQGIELMAIPHNGNISDGRMYALADFYGHKLTERYVEARIRNEPLNEVVQNKGQSMTHPLLAPKDEFADFEVYEFALGTGAKRKKLSPTGGYAHQALKNGLKVQNELGTNPFQFGLIGSSDSHNAGTNVEEDNNIGKSGTKDPTAEVRLSKTIQGAVDRRSSVGGLAAVWAKENTRQSIYEAMERKEVYATSGTRIRLRFFAAEDWQDLDLLDAERDSIAYRRGYPMGTVLSTYEESPVFLISALKDVDGAHLDRIQVIKGWIDKDNGLHESIYDVAWSEGRNIDAQGQLDPVGNTVDPSTASYTNDIGAIKLETFWSDPDYDPSHRAFYYVRVLEIPTPRWSTYDAVAIGAELPDDVPYSIQERAWSSPIWIEPKQNKDNE